ncbi:inner membrane CreD family protein [Odoribacter laneus]|uniref:inner membrane CreD family protein n=1 Tax=Odoribacter laneus TaxID=626933 RepID=UPI0011CB7FFE
MVYYSIQPQQIALLIGSLLTTLFIYIYILIHKETYAHLSDSIGLFVILAIPLYYSQKINGNNKG